jgi:hypothetical protein
MSEPSPKKHSSDAEVVVVVDDEVPLTASATSAVVEVPYFAAVANPDYKRPGFRTPKGTTSGSSWKLGLHKEFLDLHYNCGFNDGKTSVKITKANLERFNEYFYSDAYMKNAPIELHFFFEGKWQELNPTIKELNEARQCMAEDEESSSTTEGEEESEKEEESSEGEEE